MNYRKPNKADRVRTAIYVAVYAAAIGVRASILISGGTGGVPAWAILVLLGAFLLIRWHAQNTAYRCSDCGHEFEISTLTDAVSPPQAGRRRLEIPQMSALRQANQD